MKIDNREIRRLILQEVEELKKVNSLEDSGSSVTRPSVDSVDDQIDSFILKFEKSSIEDSDEVNLNESLEQLSLLALLLEQDAPPSPDDEEAAPEADPEPEEDEPGEEVSGSEKVDVQEPADELPQPNLNIDELTKRVARLIMNSDTLLNISNVIVNRTINFLLENYSESHADSFKEILDSEYDFDLEGEKSDRPAHFAVGAYAGGTGGGGA